MVSNYINKLLSFEEYSFSLEELIIDNDRNKSNNKSRYQIKKELDRLISNKKIINLRKNFYIIIPPRYSQQGHLPIQLYIEKLFIKYLKRDYYLGYFSAAKFLGASHQQIQNDYIISQSPTMLNINKNSIALRFYTKLNKNWPNKNIMTKKSDAGIFKISSPILTAVDLIHYQLKLGGLNRIITTLEELSDEIELNDLKELLTWYPHKSTLQRLGYFLEIQFKQKDNDVIEHLFKYLDSLKTTYINLNTSKNKNSNSSHQINLKHKNRWKIIVNIKLESDL